MAVYNTGHFPYRQHFYGTSQDAKPTNVYPGDRFYEFDTGLHSIWNGEAWVEFKQPAIYSAV